VGNTQRRTARRTPAPVHPHSRGEHIALNMATSFPHGPSPLAWGTQTYHAGFRESTRSIPTRVGNTLRRIFRAFSYPVHPHSRGEHSDSTSRSAAISGPSPLAWGTLVFPSGPGIGGRSIPTRVGNTSPPGWHRPPSPVHPHSRGEHSPRPL